MVLGNKRLQKWWDAFVTLQEKIQKVLQYLFKILFTGFHCFITTTKTNE